MALHAALGAAHSLPGDAPEEALALVAVGGRRGRPEHEVVRGRARDRVDQGLKGFLVDMKFLKMFNNISLIFSCKC